MAASAETDADTIYVGNHNEPSHLLYIHPSDNPNNILVSDLLNGDNYSHWKKAMEIALVAKNKLGFVQGECVRPTAANLLAHWERCDKMVLSWIMNAVVKDIGQSILFSASARDVWVQLEQRFGEADGTKIFQLQRNLCVISQGHLSVTEYFTQIKKLWDAYNSLISLPCCTTSGQSCVSLLAAKKLIKDQQLMQFLVGLHEDYKYVRGNILMIKPLPSLDQVYQLVLQEEKQRSLSNSASINGNSAAFMYGDSQLAMAVQQRNYNQGPYRYTVQSNFQSNPGHQQPNFQQSMQTNCANYRMNQRTDNKRTYYCDHCKVPGHSTQRCYKLHGYPPGHKFYRGKRVAAIAQTDNNPDAHTRSPALTAEQYDQLIQLLHKHSSDGDKPGDGGSVAGFFAGPHNTEGNHSW